jgi:membrane associated rhomboid family serine protease
LRDNLGSRGWFPVTCCLIAVCVIHYVWLRYLHYTDDVNTLQVVERQFGLRPRDVAAVWQAFPDVGLAALWTKGLTPFVTYMFLHAGPVHLLTNMLCLLVLGSRLESRSSWLRFLLFYLLCGILAGVAQCLWPQDPRTVVVGSSGAMAGVIGAYVICACHARILILVAPLPLFVEVPFWVLGSAWLLLQLPPVREFLKMGAARPVSHVAHLAGLLAGLLLWWLLRNGKRRRRVGQKGTRSGPPQA